MKTFNNVKMTWVSEASSGRFTTIGKVYICSGTVDGNVNFINNYGEEDSAKYSSFKPLPLEEKNEV